MRSLDTASELLGLEFLETDDAFLGARNRGEVRLARYQVSASIVAVK